MDTPKASEKKPFYKKWWFWAIVIFFVVGLIGSSGSETQSVATPAPAETAPAYTFDIPSLLGQDIGELKQTLGTPSEDSEPNAQHLALGVDTWEKSWSKGEYDLMATYNVQTKEVVDLFLSTNTDAAFASFSDTGNILKVGNLKKNDSRYSIEFVKALKGDGYTGAIVREK